MASTTTHTTQGQATPVSDMQMYLAFSAEHLRDAANALEKAIAAQPQLLGHWNDVVVMWRAQLPVLQAEAQA